MPFDPKQHCISLKGKEYLPVQWRLVWLREQHPDAIVVTTLVERTDSFALFRAEVALPATGARATGHGSETKSDFGDFIEKAETKAIGRALAMLGYGTQFTVDLDEGHRIVDAPVERREPPYGAASPTQRDWYLSAMHKLDFDQKKAIDAAQDIHRGTFSNVPAVTLRDIVAAAKADTITYGPDRDTGHVAWRIIGG